MTLGERIRAVRLAQTPKLSQFEFGEITGMTRAQITTYEIDKVVASDSYLKLLSLKFKVSYDWLKNGTGEMFDAHDDAFDEVAHQLNLNEFQRRLVQIIYEMPIEHQRIIRDYALKLASDDLDLTETEHERISRITNDYLDAYDAQNPGEQTDKQA